MLTEMIPFFDVGEMHNNYSGISLMQEFRAMIEPPMNMVSMWDIV